MDQFPDGNRPAQSSGPMAMHPLNPTLDKGGQGGFDSGCKTCPARTMPILALTRVKMGKIERQTPVRAGHGAETLSLYQNHDGWHGWLLHPCGFDCLHRVWSGTLRAE